MSGTRRVALNTIFLYSAEMLNPFTSMVLISLIGRNYGVAGLGQYSLVLTLYFTAVSLASLGLTTPVTRAVAARKERANDYLMVGSAIGLCAAVVAFIAVTIIVRLLQYPAEVQAATSVMMWSIFPTAITTFAEAIFLSYEKAKYVAFLSIGENTIKVLLGTLAILSGHGMVFLFYILLGLRLVACAVDLLIFRVAIARLAFKFNVAVFKDLKAVTPIFSVNLLLTVLFGRIDVILLSKLAGFTAVGLYSAAQRIIVLLLTLSVSFKRAVFPPLCARWAISPADTKRIYQSSVKYMAILGGFALVGVAQLGNVVLTMLYGKDFGGAQPALIILSVALIPGFVFPVCAALLVAVNRQGLDLASSIVRLGLLVGLNFVLVPRFQHIGAAMSFSTASLVFLVLQQACVNKAAFPAEHMRVLWRPVLASVGTSIAFLPLSWFVPWWITAPIALPVYWAALLMLGTFTREERMGIVNLIVGTWPRRTGPRATTLTGCDMPSDGVEAVMPVSPGPEVES